MNFSVLGLLAAGVLGASGLRGGFGSSGCARVWGWAVGPHLMSRAPKEEAFVVFKHIS